jgi:hypothetical protein
MKWDLCRIRCQLVGDSAEESLFSPEAAADCHKGQRLLVGFQIGFEKISFA